MARLVYNLAAKKSSKFCCVLSVFVVVALLMDTCGCSDVPNHVNNAGLLAPQDAVSVQLARILDGLTSVDEKLGTIDQKMSSFDKRVLSLEQRIIALDLRLDERTDVISSQEELRKPEPGVAFRITQVSKMKTADGYTVQVQYRASAKPKVNLLLTQYSMARTAVEEQDFGEVELKISTKNNDVSRVRVEFQCPDRLFIATINLKDTPNTMDVPAIDIHVAQGSDVRYTPGSDAYLDITWKIGGATTAVEREDDYYNVLMMSNTGEEENRLTIYYPGLDSQFPMPVWLDVVSETEVNSQGERSETRLINSKREDAEGVLNLSHRLTFNCSQNCLLSTLEIEQVVRFYREDHGGPFPEDFIGFLDSQFWPNPSRQQCTLSSNDEDANSCSLSCYVAGSLESFIQIVRILPDGSEVNADVMTLAVGNFSSATLEIASPSFADSGLYRCKAFSTNGVTMISRDISLTVVRPAQIRERVSNATRLENGSVSATCTADGVPPPDVTLTADVDLAPGDADVTVTQLGAGAVRADMLITDPGVVGTVSRVECSATNSENIPFQMMPAASHVMFLDGRDDFFQNLTWHEWL